MSTLGHYGLQILIHYAVELDDYPGVEDFISGKLLIRAGLIEKNPPGYVARYRITDRGQEHIDNLCSVRFPVERKKEGE